MGKYRDALSAMLSIFETPGWKFENIKTFPSNFNLKNAGDKFIRIDVIPSGRGLNLRSVSGILAVDIFTAAGSGPKDALLIADALDKFFLGKRLTQLKALYSCLIAAMHLAALMWQTLPCQNLSTQSLSTFTEFSDGSHQFYRCWPTGRSRCSATANRQ
jgi:hypothetical protein